MFTLSTSLPPLSPVLLTGLMVQDFPLSPVQQALNGLLRLMRARHREVFERLRDYAGQSVLFDATDLPYCFCLRLGDDDAQLSVARSVDEGAGHDASVRGTLVALLDLLQGRVDGDALFFTRDLAIEGDTELVLTLRNAVDAAEIDLADDLAEIFGPLKPLAAALTASGLSVYQRFQRDLHTLTGAVVSPARKSAARASAESGELRARIEEVERRLAKCERRDR